MAPVYERTWPEQPRPRGGGDGIDGGPRAFKLPVLRIRLYTTAWCGYCVRAKVLLEARGLPYDEIALDDDPTFRQRVFDLGNQWTVPLVTIGGVPIGGYEELAALDRSGLLAERPAA